MTTAITDPTTLSDTDLQDTIRALYNESNRRQAIADIPKQIEDATTRYQDASGLAAKRAQRSDGSWPDWSQPTGAHDAYKTGDRVTYNGHVYEFTIDANVWAPDAYPQGWKLIS